MRKMRWMALLLAALSAQALAQSGGGYYEELNYRKNDPFVFCTEGWKRNGNYFTVAWTPPPGYTSAPIPNWPLWCSFPTTSCPENYGYWRPRDWTQDDVDAYYQYVRVCPAAHKSGSWTGQGKANNSPKLEH